MRILIAGAGSIGTVLGALLSGEDEVVLLRRGHRGKVPITVTGVIEKRVNMEVVDSSTLTGHFDVVFLTTQAQHTRSVLSDIPRGTLDAAVAVTLQNGVHNHEQLLSMTSGTVVAGTVWWSATLLTPGKVYYHREADTVIGLVRGRREDLEMVLELLSPHFRVRVTDDVVTELHRKLLLNVVSPVLALVRQPYPTGLNELVARRLTRVMFEEGARVLAARGIDLGDRRLESFYRVLCSDDELGEYSGKYVHKVSTQLGVEKYGGEGSNVDQLIGELIRLSEEEVPTLMAVYDRVLSLTPDYSALTQDELEGLIRGEPGDVHALLTPDGTSSNIRP